MNARHRKQLADIAESDTPASPEGSTASSGSIFNGQADATFAPDGPGMAEGPAEEEGVAEEEDDAEVPGSDERPELKWRRDPWLVSPPLPHVSR